MATIKTLQKLLDKELKAIEKHRDNLNQIALDVDALSEPDVLQVGDRVRLLTNWDTLENHKARPGWSSCLHFMHPGNKATIVEVHVYKQKISYLIRFDNQECYYPRFYSLRNKELGYIDDHVFHFDKNELKKLNEPRRFSRKHDIGEKSSEFSLTHKRLNFETTSYKEGSWIYVRSKNPVSFYAGGRQYLYVPYTLEEIKESWIG